MRNFLVDPRDLPAGDFPSQGTSRERFLFLVRYAILAPSIHNMQPWKFAIEQVMVDNRDRVMAPE